MPKKVFLGGTCNYSRWREELIKMINIDFFNPVVKDWNEEARKEELKQREECDYCLYTITPKMLGYYSIAEAIDDSNKRPEKTIFCVLPYEIELKQNDITGEPVYKFFTKEQFYSLEQVGQMVERNGGKYFCSLEEVADYLNKEV